MFGAAPVRHIQPLRRRQIGGRGCHGATRRAGAVRFRFQEQPDGEGKRGKRSEHNRKRLGQDDRGVDEHDEHGLRDPYRLTSDPWPLAPGVQDQLSLVDLANDHLAALPKAAEPGCHVYNLGTGSGFSELQVIEAFKKTSGRDKPNQVHIVAILQRTYRLRRPLYGI